MPAGRARSAERTGLSRRHTEWCAMAPELAPLLGHRGRPAMTSSVIATGAPTTACGSTGRPSAPGAGNHSRWPHPDRWTGRRVSLRLDRRKAGV